MVYSKMRSEGSTFYNPSEYSALPVICILRAHAPHRAKKSLFFYRRDQILGDLKKEGVNCGGCGPATIRLRPALIFEPKHADMFLDKLNTVLSQY